MNERAADILLFVGGSLDGQRFPCPEDKHFTLREVYHAQLLVCKDSNGKPVRRRVMVKEAFNGNLIDALINNYRVPDRRNE